MSNETPLAYPRRLRLTSAADFSRVFKKNISCRDQYFRILAQTGNGLGFARLGQVVSRKVDKRAVSRNRIKRVVRETFRLQRLEKLQNGGFSGSGTDFVVLAQRQAALMLSNETLRASIEKLWQQIDNKLARIAGKVE